MSSIRSYVETAQASAETATQLASTISKAMRKDADAGRPLEEAADLARVEDGYTILCVFWPSLEVPAGATVSVLYDGSLVDRLDVPPARAYATWRHTACHSEPYARRLRKRPETPDE